MAENARPNFFLLLGLNPDEHWEDARFALLVEQKRREWSKESTGIGPKATNAGIYLSLLPKIQQVMSDEVERAKEAAEARKALADQKKARLEKFEQQFLMAQSKGFLEEGEVKAFAKDFADVLNEAEMRKRAGVPIRAAVVSPIKPDLLEGSKAKETAQKVEDRDEATNKSDTGTPRFLLIMPRGVEFDDLRQRIISSLQEAGMRPILWDDIKPGDRIADSILKSIELADIVIVDITGNNPNVLLETGYALGAGKPVLPIVQRIAGRVPIDISGRLYLVYDPSEPAQLSDNIKTYALRYLESRKE